MTELELLAWAARPAFVSAGELERILSGPLDWKAVMAHAGNHRMTGLLYRKLSGAREALVPPSVRQTLKEAGYRDAAHSGRLGYWAEKIAGTLSGSGIRVAAVKGLAMAEGYYGGSAGIRPMGDVDLVVDEAALGRTASLLEPLGLQRVPGIQEGWVSLGSGPVELHYPEDHVYWDLKGLLDRARPFGKPYLLPSAEDMLIFSGLHAVLHEPELKLIWLADLAAITAERSRPLDWDRVLDLMKGHPAAPALRRVLAAAHESCGADVPGRVLDRLRSRGLRGRAIAWAMERRRHPSFEFVMTHLLCRHPSSSWEGLFQRLWPTGPRVARRLDSPGESVAAWRLKHCVHVLGRLAAVAGHAVSGLFRASAGS